MENETKNVGDALTQVIDYTEDVIMEPFASSVFGKRCLAIGSVVMVNLRCQITSNDSGLKKIATLPEDIKVGTRLWFSVYAQPLGAAASIVSASIDVQSLNIELIPATGVTYIVSFMYIKDGH